MTIKQKKFTEEYIKSGNGTEAVKKAGYGRKNKVLANDTAKAIASENLTKPYIINAIDKRMAQIEAKTDLSVQKVQSEHLRLQALAESKADISTANSCLTQAGRTIGAYLDNVVNPNALPIQQLSEPELEQLRAMAARALDIRLSPNAAGLDLSRAGTEPAQRQA